MAPINDPQSARGQLGEMASSRQLRGIPTLIIVLSLVQLTSCITGVQNRLRRYDLSFRSYTLEGKPLRYGIAWDERLLEPDGSPRRDLGILLESPQFTERNVIALCNHFASESGGADSLNFHLYSDLLQLPMPWERNASESPGSPYADCCPGAYYWRGRGQTVLVYSRRRGARNAYLVLDGVFEPVAHSGSAFDLRWRGYPVPGGKPGETEYAAEIAAHGSDVWKPIETVRHKPEAQGLLDTVFMSKTSAYVSLECDFAVTLDEGATWHKADLFEGSDEFRDGCLGVRSVAIDFDGKGRAEVEVRINSERNGFVSLSTDDYGQHWRYQSKSWPP